MRDVPKLLAELECAIVDEYVEKIRALEEERDAKIDALRAFGGTNGNHQPAVAPSKPPPRQAPEERTPAGAPTGHGAAVSVRDAVATMTGRFTPDDIRRAAPTVPHASVPPMLRQLAAAGEIVLVQKGDRNVKPAIYERKSNGASPPSKAAPASRSTRDAAPQPGSTSSA